MRVFPLVIAALLCGCTMWQEISGQEEARARHLFLQGIEEMSTEGSSPSFENLQAKYPQSFWAAEAQAVSRLAVVGEAQKKQTQGLQQKNTACLKEKERLEKENVQLRDDLEKLKKLLIEIEMRAK